MIIKKCCICGLLGNGIMLREKRICLKCEKDITETNVDSVNYESYVEQIKKILFN